MDGVGETYRNSVERLNLNERTLYVDEKAPIERE